MSESDAKAPGVGARKRVEFFEATELNPPNPPGQATPEAVVEFWGDHSRLAENCGEETAARLVYEMSEAVTEGGSTTVLFSQTEPDGFLLAHVWFGPNFQLMSHSHPASGDCLYYVLTGEIQLGQKTLGPGSGFFVPRGMAYKYKVGPEGAQVLEFRGGGGEEGQPLMRLHESTAEGMQQLIDNANANRHLWNNPPRRPGEMPASDIHADQ